jgi:P4 family phage/plasmid primase-like protien
MTAPQVELTPDQLTALDVARDLARAGIPVFLAAPDPSNKTGYRPPTGWQQTVADPGVVDQWQPGLALCAVMGQGLDLADFDPRNGGDLQSWTQAAGYPLPHAYAVATTPSGGVHWYIRSLGCGSRDNVYPGVDVKSGTSDGSGRGFAFIAPTVRVSVVSGEPAAYRWMRVPDLEALARDGAADRSGEALAARVRELRATSNAVRQFGGPDWWQRYLASDDPQSLAAAEKAINVKLDSVATWVSGAGEGFRLVLLRAALTLGGYVGSGYLDEGDARDRLYKAVSEVWGTPDDDDLLWIQQGLDDGAVMPFYVYTPEDEHTYSEVAQAIARQGEGSHGSSSEPPTGPPWNIASILGSDPFDPSLDTSDQGLAEAVAARMYPVLRYARDAGTWVKRERDAWEEIKDTDAVPNWIISQLARLMPYGQTPIPKELTERTELHWQAYRRGLFMSSAGAGKIARKLRALVHSDHPAALRVAELDINPEVLWAGGVPWDLRASGDRPTPAAWIDPHTPHLHTALCAPDAGVHTPRWAAFLDAVLPDPEVRAWTLRVLSIALTGYPDAAVPVLYGRERSGKSSLIEMLVTVLGSYAHAANPKLLSAQDSSHDAIVYDLKGRRLSFIDEGPKRGHENAERLKQLTGGASLTASKKYGNPITFQPTHTLIMTTNNEPQLTDPALRARMRLIPCDEPERRVRAARLPLLGPGLVAEAPGILAQLMRETAAYLADRDSAAITAAPLTIRGLAQELGENQDPVREWVNDCTVPADPGTPGRKLYTQFAAWHQNHPLYRRMSVPTETAFGRTLTDMGFKPEKREGRWFRPLSVLGGPGGLITPPSPGQYMAGDTPVGPSGPPLGGSAAGLGGSEDELAKPQNPRSSLLSSSSFGGLAGRERDNKEGERDRYIESREGYRELSLEPPATPEEGPEYRGVTCENEAGGSALRHPPASTESDKSGKSDITSLREPTNSEVAARAYQGGADKKLTKAEARAQLKAEARLAAIRETSGEVLELPAVATRTGVVLPLTMEQADLAVAEAVRRSGALTVDVETSGYPVGHEHYELRSVQLGDEQAAVVLHPVTHAELIRHHLAVAPALHAHSATADLGPLAHAGLADAEAAWARMYDTVIPAKLADPASTGSDPGLKQLADAVLRDEAVAPAAEEARKAVFKAGRWLEKTQIDTPLEKSGWAQIETRCTTMIRYAASDVLDTAALARRLPSIPPEVLERERLVQRMTARVTHRGVRIDAEHVRRLTEQHTSARALAAERVRVFGIDNPGSNPQVAQKAAELGAELPRTPAGSLSVAEGVLDPLRRSEGALGAFVSAVLDYRHHDTVLGTFLAPYAQLCDRGDGRARPTVYTLGTDTGRMSCVRPNLQQLPREGGVRACITADPGQLMISADFSGVEIRVAAALSQDPTLMRIIAEGRDLHAEIALQVFGPDPAATAKAGVRTAAKAHRYTAKRIVFGRLYGGGIATLARQGGCDEATAQRAVDTLDQITPGLSSWSAGVREGVKQGQVAFTSYSGRVIHFPREYPHKAPNYAIQGTARELLVDAFIRWSQTQWGSTTILPVHDELDAFVPAEDAEEATQVLVQCMKSELGGVQIVAEPEKPSPFWLDSV